MHVTMELKTGSTAGRKVHLVSHQLVRVGKSSWADFVVTGEPQLADQHFSLETDAQACRIRDLSKGQGLLLNGQSVLSAVVHDGDRIRVGDAEFVLAIEGDERQAVAEPVVPGPPPTPAPMPRAKGEQQPRYRAEQLESGVMRYEGKSDALEPAAVVRRLATVAPVFAIADFQGLQPAARPSLTAPSYLFDWLGAAAGDNSPVLLQASEVDICHLVQQVWQRNALVCLFTATSKEELLVHLRKNAKMGRGQILGICWPQTLGPLLEHYRKDFVEVLLKPIRAVLVESTTAPDRWVIYSLQNLDDILTRLGLERIESEP